MAYTLEDTLEVIKSSRKHFLRHLKGIKPEQLTWKPYAECKNVIETLAHLITDDKAAMDSMESGKEPNYDALMVTETDPEKLLQMMGESHLALLNYIQTKYANTPLDTEILIWGSPMKLASAAPLISSEDYYHAGQVAFIRMATDPGWDYYGTIYSGD